MWYKVEVESRNTDWESLTIRNGGSTRLVDYFSKLTCAKERNGPPSGNQGISIAEQRHSHAFPSYRWTHPPLNHALSAHEELTSIGHCQKWHHELEESHVADMGRWDLKGLTYVINVVLNNMLAQHHCPYDLAWKLTISMYWLTESPPQSSASAEQSSDKKQTKEAMVPSGMSLQRIGVPT